MILDSWDGEHELDEVPRVVCRDLAAAALKTISFTRSTCEILQKPEQQQQQQQQQQQCHNTMLATT